MRKQVLQLINHYQQIQEWHGRQNQPQPQKEQQAE